MDSKEGYDVEDLYGLPLYLSCRSSHRLFRLSGSSLCRVITGKGKLKASRRLIRHWSFTWKSFFRWRKHCLPPSVPIYDVRMDFDGWWFDKRSVWWRPGFAFRLSFWYFSWPVKVGIQTRLREARSAGDRYHLFSAMFHFLPRVCKNWKNFPLFRLGRYKGGMLVERRNIRELPLKCLQARTIGYQREVKACRHWGFIWSNS